MTYILKDCSGEYEDYTENILCSFDNEEEAYKIKEILENLVEYLYERAIKFCDSLGLDGNYTYEVYRLVEKYLYKLGLNYSVDCTGISLFIEEVEDFRDSNLGYLYEVKYKDKI